MTTRITAEFDSVDTAELAARAVKHSADGVVKITVSGGQTGERQPYSYPKGIIAGNLGGAAFGFSNYTSGSISAGGLISGFPDISDEDIEPARSRSAELEIICEKSSEQTVSRILTGYGGMNTSRS